MHSISRLTVLLAALLAFAAGTVAAVSAHASHNKQRDPGTLDKSFSGNGIARANLAPGTCKFCEASAEDVAVDSKGRIVAKALVHRSPGFRTVLARYLPSGSLDDSFSSDGIKRFDYPLYGDFSVDSLNRIVLLAANSKLVRLGADGTPDPTFGGGDGEVELTEGNAFAVDSQDRIVVTGPDRRGFSTAVTVTRYLADGSVDPSFDDSAEIGLSKGFDTKAATAVSVDPDGGIFISTGVSNPDDDNNHGPPGLAKFLPNGGVDESFSEDGAVIAGSGGSSNDDGRVAIDSRGRIVVGTDGFIDRFRPNGNVDDTFSLDGRIRGTGGSSVAVDDHDRVLAAGSGEGLVRYRPNGNPSRSFGKDGVAKPAYLRSAALALDSHGRIVTVGALRIRNHGPAVADPHLLVARHFGG
ncbi:hypothetical protein BH10ACT11_BH10ACT11_01590 [soil metagenome]